MALRSFALAIIAAGVASFFVGLFGLAGELSPQVSVCGVAILVVGVVILIFGLRPLGATAPHFSVFVLVGLAIALHAYENFPIKSVGFSVGVFVWSLAPYVLCLIVAALSRSSIPAVTGAVIALLFDLNAHVQVFVHPSSSTAGLALLFVPLWNLLVFAPLAMLGAWLLLRLRPRANETAP